MMVLALGPTVWIAVGDSDLPAIVERSARPADGADSVDGLARITPPRDMPAPAPLAMPLQQF